MLWVFIIKASYSSPLKKKINGPYSLLAKEVHVTQILFALKFAGH